MRKTLIKCQATAESLPQQDHLSSGASCRSRAFNRLRPCSRCLRSSIAELSVSRCLAPSRAMDAQARIKSRDAFVRLRLVVPQAKEIIEVPTVQLRNSSFSSSRRGASGSAPLAREHPRVSSSLSTYDARSAESISTNRLKTLSRTALRVSDSVLRRSFLIWARCAAPAP